jgi:hypothetical protein
MMHKMLFTLVVTLNCTLAFADIESGPKAGEQVAELKVYAISGVHEGKESDYATVRKAEPTIYLFVNAEKFGRPAHRFIKTIGENIVVVSAQAEVVAVWIGADFDKNKEYLPKIQQYYSNTVLSVFNGDSNGPNGWGINSAAHITAVVVVDGKVVKSFAFESLNETDAKTIEEELKKSLRKK